MGRAVGISVERVFQAMGMACAKAPRQLAGLWWLQVGAGQGLMNMKGFNAWWCLEETKVGEGQNVT